MQVGMMLDEGAAVNVEPSDVSRRVMNYPATDVARLTTN